VGRDRLGVAPLPGLGQHHVDAAPVAFAAAPLNQAVPGQPVDQAGQRALAQVDGFGQVLGTEFTLLALGEPLEDLEVAHAEPVPLAKFALKRRARRRLIKIYLEI
jgi:hypothetical protein